MANCQHKNPLHRSGTSQQQRLLNGLKNDYVQVDEKEYADWIVFANQFAAYLNYYDNNNSIAGDWGPFFSKDVSAMLGTIAIQDAEQYKLLVADKLKALQSADAGSDMPALKKQLGDLFNLVLTFSYALDRIELPVIGGLIKSRLQPALQRLLSYYKGGKFYNLIVEQVTPGERIMNQEMRTASSIIAEGLSQSWWSGVSWTAYYAAVPEEKSIYGIEADDFRKLSHLANHNLFKTVLNEYLAAFSKIVSEAEKQLLQTLDNWSTHPAHYTLFLSFLKLFRLSRDHINTLTQRHLDFYYKDVLQLRNKPQEPNHAHIVVELAKQAKAYLLEKGTLFRAGKDALGKDVFYAMDRNVVFNKAAVAKLVSVFKDDSGNLLASPAADAVKGSFGEWHPFKPASMSPAMIGFAVASHYLFLSEGDRKVTLKLAPALTSTPIVECYLTTEKGWCKIPFVNWGTGFTSDATPCTTLSFTLEGDVPAITAFNAALHGGNYNTDVPVMKVYLTDTYDNYSKLVASKVEVAVEVGLLPDGITPTGRGLKQLMIANDLGIIESSKPFQPFGPLPMVNSSVIIGNKELFSKKGASYVFRVEWTNLPASVTDMDFDTTLPMYPSVKLRYLQKGSWNAGTDTQIFNSVSPLVYFPAAPWAIPDGAVVPYDTEYKIFDNTSTGGYLKLSLNQDFGHRSYQQALTSYLIAKAKDPATAGTAPVEPYTPLLQGITLSYKAAGAAEFFHIYPFGETKQVSPATLLPQFVHEDAADGTIIDHQGEFYIGLTDLGPQQAVNILFQVLDGSTDPLVEKPEDHVHWSYLSNNEWISFEKQDISDATNNLVQSGIISFTIPADVTTANLILPANHLWIRAAIEKNAGAVCKLLAVMAQAAQVTLQDSLVKLLPAGTITKLKDPVAAIKKVQQPYPSFGGRSTETDAHFYLRVSERLRHRARAITIWDYEHLVLEAFPQIHKVKCLNHTQIDEGIYDEVKPGYVSVITIPVLDNRNDADPLKPYTNKNLLMEIESYLSKKTSCHVNVRVRNPQFEQVKLKFELKLMPGYNDFTFYSRQLAAEITHFLTPWAFESGLDIEFGGKMHKSVLINFIEERSYVDYITNVEMKHIINEWISGDLDVIEASTARSILVSVPAEQHEIGEIKIKDTAKPEVCAS